MTVSEMSTRQRPSSTHPRTPLRWGVVASSPGADARREERLAWRLQGRHERERRNAWATRDAKFWASVGDDDRMCGGLADVMASEPTGDLRHHAWMRFVDACQLPPRLPVPLGRRGAAEAGFPWPPGAVMHTLRASDLPPGFWIGEIEHPTKPEMGVRFWVEFDDDFVNADGFGTEPEAIAAAKSLGQSIARWHGQGSAQMIESLARVVENGGAGGVEVLILKEDRGYLVALDAGETSASAFAPTLELALVAAAKCDEGVHVTVDGRGRSVCGVCFGIEPTRATVAFASTHWTSSRIMRIRLLRLAKSERSGARSNP